MAKCSALGLLNTLSRCYKDSVDGISYCSAIVSCSSKLKGSEASMTVGGMSIDYEEAIDDRVKLGRDEPGKVSKSE